MGGLTARRVPGDETRMGWGPGAAPIRDEPGHMSFPGEQLQVLGDSSMADWSHPSPSAAVQAWEGWRTSFCLQLNQRQGRSMEKRAALNSSCMTLGKFLHFCELQCPRLENDCASYRYCLPRMVSKTDMSSSSWSFQLRQTVKCHKK